MRTSGFDLLIGRRTRRVSPRLQAHRQLARLVKHGRYITVYDGEDQPRADEIVDHLQALLATLDQHRRCCPEMSAAAYEAIRAYGFFLENMVTILPRHRPLAHRRGSIG